MQVPGYRILEPLGQGATATVFRAAGPRGEVAIKVLRSVEPAALERFVREAQLQDALRETGGVVPLVDSGPIPEGAYIVMPLVRGGSLADLLRKGPLPVERTLELGRSIAETLARIHARGVVHRDLKPSNILLTASGSPLVADLGLAKHFRDERSAEERRASLTASGTIMGTLGYMAPEQLDDGRAATPRSDVFSVAAILYECLAGLRPYRGENVLDYVKALDERAIPPFPSSTGVPRWLDRTIRQGLARDPAERFADGGELLRALEPPARASRWRLVALLALAALGGSLALNGVLLARSRAAGATMPGPAPPPAPPPAPTLAPARRAVPEAAALNRSGLAHMNAGRLDEAERDFEAAIDRDPTFALAWSNRSCVYLKRGDLPKALEYAEKAVALGPDSVFSWTARGVTLLRMRKLDEARADLDKAIALDPSAHDPLVNRAIILETQGDHAGGRRDALRATELAPTSAESWNMLGVTHLDVGELGSGVAALTKAIELDPAFERAWVNRADARVRLQQFEPAKADATRAFALAKSAEALFLRSKGREGLHDWAGIVEDAREALRLDLQDWALVQLITLAGKAYFEIGDFEASLAMLDRALGVNPKYPPALMRRAELRARRGDTEGALADCERGLELRPKDERLLELKARLQSR